MTGVGAVLLSTRAKQQRDSLARLRAWRLHSSPEAMLERIRQLDHASPVVTRRS
jgi:hypothetical protein